MPVSRPAAHRNILAAISSTAAGGNWSSPATWVGGVVPTAADDVTIVAGATVTLDVAASAASLTIAATGALQTSATTAYSLQVGGSVTNNGTLDLSASTTIGSDLRFTGAGSVNFTGTGTTDLQTISLAKSVRADVVDMNLPTLSVQGSTTTGTGFLSTRTTTNTVDDMTGTLKISGTATISNRVFSNAAAYVIPAAGGFWLNNANFTVAGQTGSPTVNGSLRISAGAFNVGTSSGNSILFGSGSVYTQEGGTLSTAGRFGSFTAAAAAAAMTFTLSAGTLNVSTIGNASGTPSFGVNGTNTISGGTINLVQRSTATTPLDYYVAGTYTYTGGTVNVGTAATATNFDFRIRGTFPTLNLDNTTNSKSALLQGQTNVYGTTLIQPGANLNLNGQLLLQIGATITNNGILTGTTAGSTVYFAGSIPQTLGGSGTATTIRTISVDNSGGGATLNVPIVTTRVNLFTGNLNGTSNLTIGDGSLTIFVVQIGVASNPNTSGSLTAAPTFNIGVGAYSLIYALEATARTTGFEIPPTRVVDAVSISNTNGVVLAGGNLTINTSGVSTGTLTLTSGILTTSAANTVTIGTGATTFPTGSATAYVNGPEGITVNSATAVSRTFAVGDAAGWRPVVVSGITTSSAQTFTATVINGATGGTSVAPISGLNPVRYVRLENTANLPATARVQLSYGASDVVGGATTAVVAQAATAAGAYASLGGATATTPTTGIVSTQDLTPGNDYFVIANTEGGTLASSVTSGCAGATSGTLTLSGNATGSTVVRYEANTGSGFVPVAGTNTGTTYTFTNLTATTTFQAVLTTSDGRTVTSAPVTVTVTPVAASTFTYPAGPYCVSGATNPAPTVTGTAGGTFSSTTGLTINATTGVVTLSSSTPGTYTVTYTSPGPCPSSSTQSLTINAAPTAGFAYGTGPFCVSGTTNPTVTLAAGAQAGTFSSTTGLTISATTGTITLSSSTPGTYTVTNTVAAANGCAQVTATTQVTITAAPVATFSYPTATTYCAGSASTVTPTLGTGATAGTFSSTTGLTLSATTGVITLSSSTAGTYTVTNTVAAANGCATATATASVTIAPATSAAFAYSGATFCQSGTNPTPTVTGTAGGTFTSTTGLPLNTTTGAITLASSAPGTYTVTYTVAGACGTSSTAQVTITAAPVATFSYGTTSTYCVSGAANPAVVLGTGATAGTFSSTAGLTLNTTTGAITLSSSTPGTYTVTNTVAAANGCATATATASVTITAAPIATFSYATASACAGSATLLPITLGTGASAGTFSSTTGLTINATTGAVDPATSTAGTYTVTNTVAAAGGCAATTSTATVTINALPATPTYTYTYPTRSTVLFTSSTAPTGTTYQWYVGTTPIAGATGQTYTANGTTAPGSYTVRFISTATGCQSAASTALVVTATAQPLAGTSLNVFPNPTHDGNLNVELTGYRAAAELTVFNALGQVVFTAKVPASNGTTTQAINLRQLATGIYTLRVKTDGGTDARRIVKD